MATKPTASASSARSFSKLRSSRSRPIPNALAIAKIAQHFPRHDPVWCSPSPAISTSRQCVGSSLASPPPLTYQHKDQDHALHL